MSSNYDSSEGLATIQEDGYIPSSRMESASDAGRRVQVLMDSEKRGRSQRRALVKGLVDGNPPYRPGDLKRAARSNSCNVNWRVAEFYLNMARFAFYDVFAEVPTFATVETDFGDNAARKEWSGIITEHYDTLLRTDSSWDRVNQFSIYDMVLYGCGPMTFADENDWRNEFVPCANLILPDFSSSDPEKWEEAAIIRNYMPPELYKFIRNEKVATEMGWHPETVKKAIMQAHQLWSEGGKYKSWEWHQQQLKNNAYWYGSQCKTIQTAHYYFREFPEPGQDNGRITHCIIINPEDNQVEQGKNYLFRRVGRYKSWNQIVHPMYYDNDGGGFHHSVTGLGVKMYSAMEYQNRLICNLADKVFAPKILLKSLTSQASQEMNIVQFAEFGRLPAGLDVVQTPIGSYSEEGVMFNREITSLISSNLAQYKTALSKDSGNPVTAYEASLRASEQSKLGRTQLNHYYNQLDWLLAEKYARAVNPKLNGFMPGGRAAVKFRDDCIEAGVPVQALRKVRSVIATRTVGQGSQFLRQQALQQLLAIAPMLPSEGGRVSLVEDYIAAVAGQSMVNRYAPKQEAPQMTDQITIAMLQVAAAKEGVPPVTGGSQNHFLFAATFIQACTQAIEALKQAQDPSAFMQTAPGVIQFIDIIGPALAQHINAMKADPSRQKEFKAMTEQMMQIGKIKDQLQQQVQKLAQQQAQEQQQRQQRQQQVMSDAQLDQMEFQNKLQNANAKTQEALRQKQEKHTQALALKDSATASDITRKNVIAASDESRKSSQSTAE